MEDKKLNVIVNDYLSKYQEYSVQDTYYSLYEDTANNEKLATLFAKLHQRLNWLLDFMNNKSQTNLHYNADPSRELIAIISTIDELKQYFKGTKFNFHLDKNYESKLAECSEFLSNSGGSAIPTGFEKVRIIKYDPIFRLHNDVIKVSDQMQNAKLQLVGEGAFALVHKYKDNFYDREFARKSLKINTTNKEKERFIREYKIMKNMNFPYVLEVYVMKNEEDFYLMELCDDNLEEYISSNNTRLSFSIRKKLALQLLYGLNYIHLKGFLHRDISYRNILVKKYDGGAVTIKLSDFGLVKDLASDLTKSDSEYKGTIIDPTIDRQHDKFKNYDAKNEIYAIGCVLHFIFTGRKGIVKKQVHNGLWYIIDKCTNLDHSKRYSKVKDIIADVETLEPED